MVQPASCLAELPASGGELVVFSQGLSPNACLALRACHPDALTLVTSLRSEALPNEPWARSAEVLTLPPSDESGLLVRVLGPATQRVAALALAARRGAARCELPLDLPERVASVLASAALALSKPAVFVTLGPSRAFADGLAWLVCEALGVVPPPVVDVMQVAHGFVQATAALPLTVIALAAPDDPPGVWERLRAVLPSAHELRLWPASAGGVAAAFEHEAMLLGTILATLAERPRSLLPSAFGGNDEPLYGLGRHPPS